MSQELGNSFPGTEERNPGINEALILLRSVGVVEAVEGHGPGGIFILGQGAVQPNEHLQLLDGLVGFPVVGNKEFVPPGSLLQMELEVIDQAFRDRNRPNQAALAFDAESIIAILGIVVTIFIAAIGGIYVIVTNTKNMNLLKITEKNFCGGILLL